MYPNLEAEMKRRNISNDDIAKVLNKGARTIRSKRSGESEFTLNECMMIRDSFFVSLTIEYLFSKDAIIKTT